MRVLIRIFGESASAIAACKHEAYDMSGILIYIYISNIIINQSNRTKKISRAS